MMINVSYVRMLFAYLIYTLIYTSLIGIIYLRITCIYVIMPYICFIYVLLPIFKLSVKLMNKEKFHSLYPSTSSTGTLLRQPILIG